MSAVLLSAMVLGTDLFADQVVRRPGGEIAQAVGTIALLLGSLAALAIVSSPIAAAQFGLNKPIPPFAEPAQFAIAAFPILVFSLIVRARYRWILITVCAFVLILIFQNLTSLLILALALSLLVPVRPLIKGIFGIAMISALLSYDVTLAIADTLRANDFANYADRIEFQKDQNLSTLVFLQGWEIVGGAVAGTDQLGVGFQQLGLGHIDSESGYIIGVILGSGETLNRFDGSFLAAKLMGEFGLLGIVPILALTLLVVRSYLALHRHYHGLQPITSEEVFAHACIFALSCEIFIRGAGYFTIGTALAFFSFFLLARIKSRA